MTRPAGLRSVPLFSSQARQVLSSSSLRLSGSSPAASTETTPNGDDRIKVSGSLVDEVKGLSSECNSCHVTFEDRAEQVAHYRLDWHRYNLKRRLRGLPHVTQEKFEEDAGELSSISGSESDSEDLDEATPTDSTHQSSSSPLVSFTSDERGIVYSVYRVILTGGKEYRSNEGLLPSLLSLSLSPCWIILMRAGGHFAGAVFRGSDVVVHKTFHRYTVRAKRGTAQSVRDNQSGGHGPKSAGASLRRYNESALQREVQGLLQTWSAHLQEATAIFIRAPKAHMTMFTGGRTPLVSRDDPRVRGIPFPTRRPTLKEVKRVHTCLASVYYHGNVSKKAVDAEKPSPAILEEMVKTEATGSAVEDGRVCCEEVKSVREGEEEERVESGDCDSGVDGDETQREGEGKKKRRRKKRKKVDKPWREMSLSPLLVQLLTVCERGGEEEEMASLLRDLSLHPIYSTLQTTPPTNELSGQTLEPVSSSVLNQLYGGVTPLHLASEHGHPDLVKLLLQHGADPTLKDSGGRVPYLVAMEKCVRDSYRRFMGQWPETHDYSQTQIPSPLTEDMERERREKAAEKKREKKRQAKKKKSKEKVRQEEEEVAKKQGEAVLGLSEREKRALAAEKRLALQNSSDSSVKRAGVCSCCGRGLAGLVPFHRLQYHYCSMPCVKEHRTRLENP